MTTIKQTHAPESCELINCEPPKPKRPYGDDKPFIMKNNEEAIKAFKYWLKKQTYNGWTFGFTDKRDQPLIGLSLSKNPENEFSRGERAGKMFKLFEQKCLTCGELHFGVREGGKAKGRWLGFDDCPKCRELKDKKIERPKP